MSQTANAIATAPPAWPAPNMMVFFYDDRINPVADTDVTLVALGRFSNNGRPTSKDSPLLNDWELSPSGFATGGNGEIALDDPALLPGYDRVSDMVQSLLPGHRRWEGVPGQPTPRFRGGVHPLMDSSYPRVPVIAELRDHGFRPSTVIFPMAAGQWATSWERPPLARMGRSFQSATAFLGRLVQEYSALRSRRTRVWLQLTRLGAIGSAPALHKSLEVLERELGRRPRVLDKIAENVMTKLAPALGIRTSSGLAHAYQQALERIERLALGNPRGLPIHGLPLGQAEAPTIAVLEGCGVPAYQPIILRPNEDWVALGALVFLIGCIVLGHRTGTVRFGTDPNFWECTVTLGI